MENTLFNKFSTIIRNLPDTDDAIRDGRAREQNLAAKELEARIAVPKKWPIRISS